jgi:hypothetical protein
MTTVAPRDNYERVGKTKRDKASGAWARRFTNRALRVEWQHNGGQFPLNVCNGKRSRALKRSK